MTLDIFLREQTDALREGKLTFDCPFIRLTKEPRDALSELCGPGFVSQRQDGSLYFKVYAQRD